MTRENLEAVLGELRRRNKPVPKPLRRPTDADVDLAERELGIQFHRDYRRFLLAAGDVVLGTKEPLMVVAPESHVDLVPVIKECWSRLGIPRTLFPFCEDNGNYFCLTESGAVVYWDHDGPTDETWPDLASWIRNVWLDAG